MLLTGVYKVFKSLHGRIEWSFILNLYNLQEELGLKFANKLSRSHIEFYRNKMKVKYAVQALSSSVADAIDWLRNEGVPEFQGSEPTTKFIRILDRIFDFLNSRNPFGKEYKKPIFSNNIGYFVKKTESWIQYLNSLTTLNGIPLIVTRRKCFVIGFVTSLNSILTTARDLLATQYYKYVLTYKFSQDHLELFFAVIRLRLGCNNNPNALQLKYINKKILLKKAISVSSATNCALFDSEGQVGSLFPIFSRRSRKQHKEDWNLEDVREILTRVPELNKNAFLKDNILHYIAGFIIFKLIPIIDCSNCCLSLKGSAEHFYTKGLHSFTMFKNKGGLHIPSPSVFRIVKECEMFLQSALLGELKNLRTNVILYNVKRQLFFEDGGKALFPALTNCTDNDLDNNHKVTLFHLICEKFMKIRLYSLEKKLNDRVSVRSKNLKGTVQHNND